MSEEKMKPPNIEGLFCTIVLLGVLGGMMDKDWDQDIETLFAKHIAETERGLVVL